MNIIESGARILSVLGLATMACARVQPVAPETKISPTRLELPELPKTSITSYFRRNHLKPDEQGLLKYPIIDYYDISNLCPTGSTEWRIYNRGLHPHGILDSKGKIIDEMGKGSIRLYIEEEEQNGWHWGKFIVACDDKGFYEPAAEGNYEIFLGDK